MAQRKFLTTKICHITTLFNFLKSTLRWPKAQLACKERRVQASTPLPCISPKTESRSPATARTGMPHRPDSTQHSCTLSRPRPIKCFRIETKFQLWAGRFKQKLQARRDLVKRRVAYWSRIFSLSRVLDTSEPINTRTERTSERPNPIKTHRRQMGAQAMREVRAQTSKLASNKCCSQSRHKEDMVLFVIGKRPVERRVWSGQTSKPFIRLQRRESWTSQPSRCNWSSSLLTSRTTYQTNWLQQNLKLRSCTDSKSLILQTTERAKTTFWWMEAEAKAFTISTMTYNSRYREPNTTNQTQATQRQTSKQGSLRHTKRMIWFTSCSKMDRKRRSTLRDMVKATLCSSIRLRTNRYIKELQSFRWKRAKSPWDSHRISKEFDNSNQWRTTLGN